MGLFTPAWKNKEPEKRLKAILKINDNTILKNMATTDSDFRVRRAAYEKMGNPQKMSLEFKNNEHKTAAAINAVEQITDKEKLIIIASSIPPSDTSRSAMDKLSQTDLKNIYDKYRYTDLRSTLLSKINDQAILADIVFTSSERSDKAGIFNKITDQQILYEYIIKYAQVWETLDRCIIAVKKITDSYFLQKIIDNENIMPLVKSTVLENITDTNLLSKLALNSDEKLEVRQKAIEKISDQNILLKIALSQNEEKYTRIKAIEKIINQDILIKIAENTEEEWVFREKAILHIKNNDAIAELAINQSDERFIQFIHESSAWSKIYKSNGKKELREIAFLNLGGWACHQCHFEYLPKSGERSACICPKCNAENHNFIKKQKVTSSFNDHENFKEWEECSKCGKIQKEITDYRYTDW